MAAKSASDEGPKAAGCLITYYDIPRICATFSGYGAQLGSGASVVTLGLAIPSLALGFDLPAAVLGQLFVVGGIGYFFGVLLSAQALEQENLPLSKVILMCIFSCIAGVMVFLMTEATSLLFASIIVTVEYFCFGFVDNFLTVALNEMWGQRVQVSNCSNQHFL